MSRIDTVPLGPRDKLRVPQSCEGLTEQPGRSAPPEGGSDLRRFVVPGAIAIYSLYAAESVYNLPKERLFFALIALASGILAMGARRRLLPRAARSLCVLWIGASVLYFAVSFLQLEWSPSYVFGDLLLGLLPLLMVLALFAAPRTLASAAPLYFLIAVLAFSAVEAQIVGTSLHRHDPPSPFLIAAAWYLAVRARGGTSRAVGFFLVLLTGYLTYTSGYRTHFLLWLCAPIMILLVLRGWKSMVAASAALLTIFLSLSLAGHPFDISRSLNDTRFSTVTSGTSDTSLDTRFSEARDVLSTASREWVPGEQLVGYGFGASYEPHDSNITGNMDAHGRVHNIHIGPMLVFFRFGILGLGIMCFMILFAIRMVGRLRVSRYQSAHYDTYAIMAFSLILFQFEFLTLNASVEPLMSYSLAGLIVIWMWERPGELKKSPRGPRA